MLCRMLKFKRVCTIISISGLLSACGGGGDGSTNGAVDDSASTHAPTVPNQSVEDRHSKYIIQTKADYAHKANITGSGVTVAVIDTGINASDTEFAGRIDQHSISVSGSPNDLSDTLNHGTGVASLIGANQDDRHVKGVAYNSNMLIIKADSAAGSYPTQNLTAALEHATKHKADIINLSLAGATPAHSSLVQALQEAVDAGALIVSAAGNSSAGTPEFPARYAGTLHGPGELIAVGAVDENNNIANFSNTAGNRKDHFLVAPGVNVSMISNSGSRITQSGTSFAAPIVSGAAALLHQQSPHLTGSQIATLLLENATDLGERGVDEIYGHGLLNVEAAMEPFGATYIPTGERVADSTESKQLLNVSHASIDPVIASALNRSGILANVMSLDAFDRPYTVDTRELVKSKASSMDTDMARWSTTDISDPATTNFQSIGTVSLRQTVGWSDRTNGKVAPYVTLEMPFDTTDFDNEAAKHRVAVSYNVAPSTTLELTNPSARFVDSPFENRTFLDATGHSLNMAVSSDISETTTLGFAIGADIVEDLDISGRVTALSIATDLSRNSNLSVTGGYLTQSTEHEGSILLNSVNGAFGMADDIDTRFVNLAAGVDLTDDLRFDASYSFGAFNNMSQNTGLIRSIRDVTADSFSIGLTKTNTGLVNKLNLRGSDSLELSLSQPLRIKSGAIALDAPITRQLDGTVERAQEVLNLKPSSRALKLEANYALNFKRLHAVGPNIQTGILLKIGTTRNPNHAQGASNSNYLGLKFRRSF